MVIYEQIFQKNGLSLTQLEIVKLVDKEKTILEIGSSTGYMTKAFIENKCIVDVVENDKNVISKVPKKVRKIFNQSIEDNNIYKKLGKYDFIIMADVLEHLINPDQVLKNLLNVAAKNTKLIISVPNIASWPMRKQLFFYGDFEYQESGILDKTHLHFFTVDTLPKKLQENGWIMEKMIGTITRFPLEGLISKIPVIKYFFKRNLYKKLVEKSKNLSFYHFLVIAHK